VCRVPRRILASRSAAAAPSPLSLHGALPIFAAMPAMPNQTTRGNGGSAVLLCAASSANGSGDGNASADAMAPTAMTPANVRKSRSGEHTSELQSREKLVCRLLLEKKDAPGIG